MIMAGIIKSLVFIIIPKPAGSDTLPYPAQKNANIMPILITNRVSADLFSETCVVNTIDTKYVVIF